MGVEVDGRNIKDYISGSKRNCCVLSGLDVVFVQC